MPETNPPTEDAPWPPPQTEVSAPPGAHVFDPDPEPEPCSCCESAWLRRRLTEAKLLMAHVHNDPASSPELRRRIKEVMGVRSFYCAHPDCPGYTFRASETPHPADTCGAKVTMVGKLATSACVVDREDTPEGDRPIAELVIDRVRAWLRETAVPDRGSMQWDWATLKLDLRYEGEDDEAGRSCYRCHFTEELTLPEAEGHG